MAAPDKQESTLPPLIPSWAVTGDPEPRTNAIYVSLENPSVCEKYVFGHVEIPSSHVFLRTPLTFAFVNLRPLLTGHVLIAPIRPVQKVKQMTDAEVIDFFRVAQMVNRRLEDHFNVRSTTMVIQDGPEASQSVAHVHCHLIPRTKKDMDTRELYAKLAEETGLKDRTFDDMKTEATIFWQWFYTDRDLSKPMEMSKETNADAAIQHLLPRRSQETAMMSGAGVDGGRHGRTCDCDRCRQMQCPRCRRGRRRRSSTKRDQRRADSDRSKQDSIAGQSSTTELIATPTPALGTSPFDRLRRLPFQIEYLDERKIDRASSIQDGGWTRTALAGVMVACMALGVVSVVKPPR